MIVCWSGTSSQLAILSSLELKVPPVAVVLLCGAGMWLLSRQLPELSYPFPGHPLLASLVAAVGAAIGVSGVIAFRAAKTTVDPRYPDKASSMVRSGIYRKTRNPMYLGLLLLLLGWALFLSHALAVIGLPVFVLYMNRFQIGPEERAMQARFGIQFSDYCLAVRRWI